MIIDIGVTALLLFWPVVFGTSFMMFDAPGSTNDVSHILFVLAVLAYPAYIFLLYWIFRGTYFGISGRTMTIVSVVVVVAISALFYGRLALNAVRGVQNAGITITADRVYYNGKALRDADPATFEPVPRDSDLDWSDYHTDANYVYFRGDVIENADARAFAPASITERPETYAGDAGYFRLSSEVYTDGTRLFLFGAPLSQSNGGPLTAVGERHFIHDNRVYHDRAPIETADPESFEALSGVLGKDARGVFFYAEPVRPAPDIASFSIVPGSSGDYATDAEHVYHFGQDSAAIVRSADPRTFSVLERGYAKDTRRVYHSVGYERPVVVEGADPESFVVTGWDGATRSDARDAHRRYQDGKPVD
ncbi:MAG: hypothetical protein GVY14_15680 [Spirochaetes bacterium]|jgi:hypothetical protein|nr:hypothetical protein [Spirochaetota bacterium]